MSDPATANDLSRLAIHTITTKPWPIETAIDRYAEAGIGGISVWRDALEGRDIGSIRRRIDEAGLTTASYVRGGFFPHPSLEQRKKAIDENRRIIAEAAELGAPHIVLVCGAHPELNPGTSRAYITEALDTLAQDAAAANVQLGIEPLHPMYAGDRSAVVTLSQANDIAERLDSKAIGVVADVYHLWWDDRLDAELTRACANNSLLGFHVCDWRVPTRDMLNDREIMGKGCIDVRHVSGLVKNLGYTGLIEVEIFSTAYWAGDQDEFLREIIKGYREHVVS